MIEDTVKIVNGAIKDRIQVTLIIHNRAGGNAPLIAQKIAGRFHSEKQQRREFRGHNTNYLGLLGGLPCFY